MTRVFLVCMMLSVFLWPLSIFAYFDHFERLPNNVLGMADWTPPTSMLMVNNRQILETVLNGDFSDDLNGWSAEGDVTTANGTAKIGQQNSSLADNSLTQTLPNMAKTLSFRYRVTTTETLADFDDPCFIVTINGQQVFVIDSSKIPGENQRSTDWKTFAVDLSSFSADTLTIKFSAGNTGDTQFPSWVELSTVTTNLEVGTTNDVAVLQTHDTFDPSPQTFFQNCDDSIIDQTQQLFFLEHPNCIITFWSVDGGANVEPKNSVLVDVVSPNLKQYQTLSASLEPTGEYVLTFSLPDDQSFSAVKVYRSPNPIEPTDDLNALEHVTQTPGTEHIVHPGENQLFVQNYDTSAIHFLVFAIDEHENAVAFTEI